MAERLHLPFAVLTDEACAHGRARLPTLEVEGPTLIKRLTLIVDGAHRACVLSGVSAGPERRRRAGLAEGQSDLRRNEIRAGEHFNPHVSTGNAPTAYLDQMIAEPFELFAFSPAGAAVYQLGPFGTAAAKKLHQWDLK